MLSGRAVAVLLLPLILAGWTPPTAVQDQPILIPAEGGGDYDTGVTLRQFMNNCDRLFGNGKLEFTRRTDGFSMRCAFANPSIGQLFSNVSDFTPTVLVDTDALKLERFRGPDGVPTTPAQLKEVFDRIPRATAKPAENNSLHFVTGTQPPDPYLALRTQPSSRQGSRVKIMPNGTFLQVLQRQDDGWWYVRVVPSGEEGWTLSGHGSRQWIKCCGTFDPKEDAVAVTLEELIQKFDRHKNVLAELETERKKFTSGPRCRFFEYWVKQSSDAAEISINCHFSSGGETGESSVTMTFAADAAGRMWLAKKDYAG